MKTLRITFIAAVLTASSAYASAASPDWTAAIGTGHASSADTAVTVPSTTEQPSAAHWSASIGTGQVARPVSVKPPASGVVVAGPHWASKIGTGRAAG
jgi:hypothetical protein